MSDPSSLPEPVRQAAMARVSDADRDHVVERLRLASSEGRLELDEFADRVADAYRSTTRAELDRLTVDLPAPARAAPVYRPTRWTIGVLSSERRLGPWRPANPTRAWATFGSCRIELADLVYDEPEVELRATAVFGGIEIVVPEGARVELGGFAVFGSKSYRIKPTVARSDLPLVRIRARVVFGSLTVRNPRPRVP